MSDNTPFETWWNAYLEGRLSPDEYWAFMQAVKSGYYDKWMEARIDESIALSDHDIQIPHDRAQHILRNIQQSDLQTISLISKSRPIYRRLRWYAAAAALIVLVAGVGFFLTLPSKHAGFSAVTTVLRPAVSAPATVKRIVNLPDGSRITLRDNSTLDIPTTFNTVSREVTLRGEGYFEIESDPAKPFQVHTGNLTVTVLGTVFNVRAYQDQPVVAVAVASGKVRLSHGSRSLGLVLPDEQLEVNRESFRTVRVNADLDSVLAWKEEYLKLEDLTLVDAAAKIALRYGVEVRIADSSIRNLPITASFLNQESLRHVLDVVCQTVDVQYTMKDGGKVVEINKGNSENPFLHP